ncbi:MAG: hypothetical protein LBU89_01885, partial [Fibromonadaceae bacterium]|nr:hypothetical protein [Fibromonadaceae bacterium]
MKKTSTLKVILMLMLGVQAIFAQTNWIDFADTDWYNASETEFTINTAAQLAGLAKLVTEGSGNNFFGKTIRLGQNIVLNDTTGWANWEDDPPARAWRPIGGLGQYQGLIYQFSGTFDGNGFVISGVYMDNTYGYYRGLFGYTNSAAIIKNLGVVASYIKANNQTGGLVGYNNGLVNNSYFIGTIVGAGYSIGGLVGYNSGIINNSYSVGKVIGGDNPGVGGLVGSNTSQSIEINSYYNKEISGQSDEGKGVGKTTEEMQSKAFSDSLNFFAGILSANAWVYSAGKYPALSQAFAHTNISGFFDDGNGTETRPYIISTKKQLEDFSWLVNSGAHFSGEFLKLGRDIVLNDTANWQNWATPPANKWTSIGTFISSGIGNIFNGTFDGDGFVVSGVYINDSNSYQGLFGYLNSSGTIKNIGVAASYIKGDQQIGGLVGSSLGAISNSYFMGTVTGESNVGGLVGSNYLLISGTDISTSSISNSYFMGMGTVTGGSYVGGLVGSNKGGTISNSYSFGGVIGSGIGVGGLVGENAASTIIGNHIGGTISNSYSVGKVGGTSVSVGGLVGSNSNGTINGYYNTDLTSHNNGLGTGKTTAEMKQRTTFSNWNFNATWGIDSKINNGYPYLRWSIPDIAWFDDSKSEFLITESQQLAGFATLVNAGHSFSGKTVTLGQDIKISDTTGWQSWASNPPANRWVPIGTLTNSFAGTFDGNGNVVYGIYINDSHGSFQGLFGVANGATIKNVGVIAS